MAKYLRLPSDIFNYEQFIVLESYEDHEFIVILWLKLLTASKFNKNTGVYEYAQLPIMMTDTSLSIIFGQNDLKRTINAFDILESLGFIKRSSECISIIPFWFDKHDRNSLRYKQWRVEVFKRDEFTCQACGSKKEIQAHHIIHWSDTSEDTNLRYDVNNGITLCKKCHLAAHGGSWRG